MQKLQGMQTTLLDQLKSDLEKVSENMIDYFQSTVLVLNNGKTQLLVNSKKKFVVQMGSSLITTSSSINILGVDNGSNLLHLNKLINDKRSIEHIPVSLIFK